MRSTMMRVSSGDAPDSMNVVIGPGKQGLHSYRYPSTIVGPTWIEWDFEVEEHEIDFWVEAAPAAGGQPTRLFPQPGSTEGTSIRWEGRRYKAGSPVSGHVELTDLGTVATPMTVKLVFSNQTAWTRDRKVKYAVRGWPLAAESSDKPVKRSAEEEAIHAVASRLAGFAMHGEPLVEADMRHMLFQPTSQGRHSQRFDEDPVDSAPPTKQRLLLAVASCAPNRSPAPRPGYHLNQPYVTIINGLRAWQDATGKALLAVAPEPPVLPVPVIESPPVLDEHQTEGEGPQEAASLVLPERKSFIQLIDLVREELQYDTALKPREVIKEAAEDLGIELRSGAGKRGEIEQVARSLGLIEEEPEPEHEHEPEPEPEPEPDSTLHDDVDPEAAVVVERESEPEPDHGNEHEPECDPELQLQAAPEQETELHEEGQQEPDSDRELELDEPRWYKQSGMEWARYDAATCRKIERGYLVYKDEEREWTQQKVAQFEQERVERDTGFRESMSANLAGAGIVQKRDQPKFDLTDGSQLDFENMREVSKNERGGQKRVKVKREEPTEADRNQAKDFRTRQSILQELVLSESSYLEALEELDRLCFEELRKVEASNMSHACEALLTAFDALLRLHRTVVTQLQDQIGETFAIYN